MYLNTHSHYSFRYGLLSPGELVNWAKEAGYSSVAMTDINNTAAAMSFIRLAGRAGLRPAVGIDFRRGVEQLYVGLAQNMDGFEQLNHFLSGHLTQEKIDLPDIPCMMEDVFFIYPVMRMPDRRLHDHEYVGIRLDQINQLGFSIRIPREKLVLLQPGSFRDRTDHNTHKILRAIDMNTIYSKVTSADYASPTDMLISRRVLCERLKGHEYLLAQTEELLSRCIVDMDFNTGESKNLRAYTGTTEADSRLIRQLCRDKLYYRFPRPTQDILDRITKELNIIEEKKFVSYFLINWDIARYARDRGYFYVGRGSGANSVVAYLLQITNVDPIELDLYFERFINLYRETPPDFDVDFSWRDREDVTRYIFNRFPNTALLATYNTFQYRAAVRELGKVFGLPKAEQDVLSEGRFNYADLDQYSQLVVKYAQVIHDMPSHLSVHAGGIVISDLPIQRYTATFVPPKGFPTTQFDMVVAEDIGLHKFDILGQRGLAKIKDGLKIVRANNPSAENIDIHDIKRFKEDGRVKDLLREGKAIGCFYVESPAMRMLLRKLRVDNYLGLVAASSIIRPGVARSGMMREYILRERFPEKRKEAHPVMLDIMPDTYGIMVYQEDVIKVAHYFAGLTLGEADVLRRGMSGKYRSREEFDRVRQKYFDNCAAKGYAEDFSREIWRQIESFAGYAFAKGHSASYAVESYQTLFLKAHYPLEYMVATINNGGGFYRSELYIHEARMHGGNILAPCINNSEYACVISGKDIYLGMGFICGVELDMVQQIVMERKRNGRYGALAEFVDRTCIGLEQLCLLIRINALRSLGEEKKILLWKAYRLLSKTDKKEVLQPKLFSCNIKEYTLPTLSEEIFEDAFDQMELLGFPLCDPFSLVEDQNYPRLLVSDLPQAIGKTVRIIGYLITMKDTKTVKGERMGFGTFIDLKGDFLDTVHFPSVAKAYPVRGKGVYLIAGKVTEEFGFYSIEVSSMTKLPYITDPRFSEGESAAPRAMLPSRRRKSLKKEEKQDL